MKEQAPLPRSRWQTGRRTALKQLSKLRKQEQSTQADLGGAHIHHIVQSIVQYEGMSHPDAVRLHRVSWPIVVIANVWIIEVGNLQRSFLAETSDMVHWASLDAQSLPPDGRQAHQPNKATSSPSVNLSSLKAPS